METDYFFLIYYFCLLKSVSIFDITSKLLTIIPDFFVGLGVFTIEGLETTEAEDVIDCVDLVSIKLPWLLRSASVSLSLVVRLSYYYSWRPFNSPHNFIYIGLSMKCEIIISERSDKQWFFLKLKLQAGWI